MLNIRSLYKCQSNSWVLLLLLLSILYTGLKQVFSRCEDVAKERKTRDHLAWDVYSTQDILCMKTARVNQEEEEDTKIILKE